MILDKVLHGVLDQQRGILLVYDEPVPDVRPSPYLLLALTNEDLVEHVRRSDRNARAGRKGS